MMSNISYLKSGFKDTPLEQKAKNAIIILVRY